MYIFNHAPQNISIKKGQLFKNKRLSKIQHFKQFLILNVFKIIRDKYAKKTLLQY